MKIPKKRQVESSPDSSIQEHPPKKARLGWDNKQINSQFLFAASRGNEDLVLKLLNMGANINATNDKGQTALFLVADKNHLDMAKLLISKGISLDITITKSIEHSPRNYDILLGTYSNKTNNSKTYSALSYAKTPEMIRLLIFSGIDTSIIHEDHNDSYRYKNYSADFSKIIKEAEIEKINQEYAYFMARQLAQIFNKATEIQTNSFPTDSSAFNTLAELVALHTKTPFTPQAYNCFKNKQLIPMIEKNKISMSEPKAKENTSASLLEMVD